MFSWRRGTDGNICIKGRERIERQNFWRRQLRKLWAARALGAALVMFSLAKVINHWDICVLTFDLIVSNYSISKWVDSVTKQPDIKWTDSRNLFGVYTRESPRKKTTFLCVLPGLNPSEWMGMVLHYRWHSIACQGSMQLCVIFWLWGWINICGGKLN